MSYLLFKFFETFSAISAPDDARDSQSSPLPLSPLLRLSFTISFAGGCLVGVKP